MNANNKGYTVHLKAVDGRAVCGVAPRLFLGKYSPFAGKRLSATCAKCLKAAAEAK